jgi:hypothetical protein
MTQGGLGPGVEPAEHLKEDTGRDQAERRQPERRQSERREDDKSLIDKAKDRLKGS